MNEAVRLRMATCRLAKNEIFADMRDAGWNSGDFLRGLDRRLGQTVLLAAITGHRMADHNFWHPTVAYFAFHRPDRLPLVAQNIYDRSLGKSQLGRC
jgi:hypothetical protein